MGLQARARPKHLARKLEQLRERLGLSQTEMLTKMGLAEELPYQVISKNESGAREPTLIELLEYARLANVYLEVLVDDRLELPDRLPCREKSLGVKQK